MPSSWDYETPCNAISPEADSWWTCFNDTTLNSLIADAVKQNYNLSQTQRRIELAQRNISLTKSGYFPNVSASAGWQTTKESGASTNHIAATTHLSAFNLGLTMNWEIDLFGRISSQLKADRLNLDVSQAQYDAAMVAMAANLAKAYFQLRTYQMQRAVALRHIASQEKIFKIALTRHEVGLGNALEVAQARIVLLDTKGTLPQLESSIITTANSIAVLLGKFPNEVTPMLVKAAVLPDMPDFPDVGVPSELLRRRPDLIEVEAQLALSAAQIGIAKKDFLPAITLTGNLGTTAHKLNHLFGAHSMDYSIAPTLSWTVFDGMARNIKVAEARIDMLQAIDNYNLTLINAFNEVDNALAQYRAIEQQISIYDDLMKESEKELSLALELYKQGLVAYSDVADAQTSWLQYQNSLVEAQGNGLAAIVSIYEALGSGY